MIVRILSEGQYRLDSRYLDQLNELDNSLVGAVAAGDEARYRTLLGQMLALVRERSSKVLASELLESDIMLPAADTTLREAQSLFVGEGLVPG